MNTFVGLGRLTKDPEVRYTTGQNQLCVAKFTIAIQDRNNIDRADFIQCKAFGKTAENAERYLHKGELIGVEGKLASGSYTIKDGRKVFYMEVVVNNITYTPKVHKNDALDAQQDEDTQAEIPTGFEHVTDEDIPF